MPPCNSLLKPGAASDKNESKENNRKLFSEPSTPVPKKRKTCKELDINDVQVKILDKIPIQDLKFKDYILGKGAFGLVRRAFKPMQEPDLENIPKFLFNEIKNCFNYVYHLRPKTKEILQIFKLCGDKLDSD
uniref:Protein kinase domain-containing protein n=1 Tax=Trichogramma kaykai TaxID=54128 RepID=A0ABD2X704_9HYME